MQKHVIYSVSKYQNYTNNSVELISSENLVSIF